MICFHHNDLDGHCAAAIVLSLHYDCRMVEVDYRSDLPIDQFEEGEAVYIMDRSLASADDWRRLFTKAGRVCWIDHDETSIKKAPEWVHFQNDGITDTKKCGALLTWEWLRIGESTPFAVYLIDAWDRWQHGDADEVLDFVAGMKAEDHSATSALWPQLFDESLGRQKVHQIQQQGKTVRRCDAMDNRHNLETYGHEIELDGLRCLAVNSIRRSSLVFGDRLKDYDMCIAYVYDGKKWTVSLYSETIKVNEIAMRYGGGGHSGATGFICEELPWKLNT